MGSGKSAVGQRLAADLNLEALDLDVLIEKSEQATVETIFLTQGELRFRKLEHDLFKNTLAKESNFVLSLGGGTPCYANNHLFLRQPNVISIYLKTGIDTLVNRLQSEKHQRPLLAHLAPEDLADFVGKHLFERSYFYNQALFAVTTDNKSIEDIVAEIKEKLA